MLHAPTSETKQRSGQSRTKVATPKDHELHPSLGASIMLGWAAGAGGESAQREHFAGLQRTIGNQAVLRMLSHRSPTIQTKLKINEPGDQYEQEADRVAERVMRTPDRAPVPVADPTSNAGIKLQRRCTCGGSGGECAACKEKQEEGLLQRNAIATSAGSEAPPIVHEVLRSPGQPLDSATRAFFEPRFGRDFSRVRMHSDATADESARSVQARAFTTGSHIVVARDQYSPGSDDGARLLSHELAHVVQQNENHALRAKIQRWTINSCTFPEQVAIEGAITRAYDDLTLVLPHVKQRPVPDNVKNALYLAFRDDSDATADLVRDNIGRLQSEITSTHFVCVDRDHDRTCSDGDAVAYSHHGDPAGVVTICRPRFFSDDTTIYAQSETVIHEAAHIYLSIMDRGYFSNRCAETATPPGVFDPSGSLSGTAGDNPALRLDNADSYGCFVYFMRYLQPPALQSTVTGYRGVDLAIEQVDDLDLYTQATTPQLHRYRVAGVPDNSGFQYRWELKGGSVTYSLASLTGGGTTSAFSENNRQVYVPAVVAHLLEENRVAQVTLVCEIQFFRAYGNRFVPPVVTKKLGLTVVVGRPPVDF